MDAPHTSQPNSLAERINAFFSLFIGFFFLPDSIVEPTVTPDSEVRRRPLRPHRHLQADGELGAVVRRLPVVVQDAPLLADRRGDVIATRRTAKPGLFVDRALRWGLGKINKTFQQYLEILQNMKI